MSASWPEEHPSVYDRKTRVKEWLPALAVLVMLGAALFGCAGDSTTTPTGTPAISSTVATRAPAETESSAVAGQPDTTVEATQQVAGRVVPVATPSLEPTLAPIVEPEAETQTPHPTSKPTTEATPEEKGPSIHRRDSYEHEKLDVGLVKLVVLFETYPEPGPSVGPSETLAYFPVRVSILLTGNPNPTIEWLEKNGVVRAEDSADELCVPPRSTYCLIQQDSGEQSVDAQLSLSLLAPLSVRPDVQAINSWAPFDNLRSGVAELYALYRTGLNSDEHYGSPAGLRPDDVFIETCWRIKGHDSEALAQMEDIINWTRANGALANGMFFDAITGNSRDKPFSYRYTLYSKVPISMIPEFSSHLGNTRTQELCGYNKPDKYFPYCCWGLESIQVGRSEDFILLTVPSVADDLLLTLEEGEEGGVAAIGSCDAPDSNTVTVNHADTVTIVACSAGSARVTLYEGDTVLWEDNIELRDFDPAEPVLEIEPPILNPREPSLHKVFKVGESVTLKLKTSMPNPPGVKVSINDDDWDPDQGNLTFRDCPGGIGDSVTMGNGDTVTVTACSPGNVAVNAWYWYESGGYEIPSGFGISVWGDPSDYAELEP